MMKRGLSASVYQSQAVIKKNYLKLFVPLLAIFVCTTVTGQQKKITRPPMKRCGTTEAIIEEMKTNPEFRDRILQGQKDYQNSIGKRPLAKRPSGTPLTLPGPVTVPVVVHVVLPNPWIISDDAIQRFIDRLNLDFSGLNPDSTNAEVFYPVRGHSLIRFTLAKRDPDGKFTTGILRVKGTTQILQTLDEPIKRSSTPTGGSTGWDVTKYYNIFVGDGTSAGLLGISPGIGPGGPATATNADGVCVDYRSFTGACFSYPEYNMGRTGVHEIGHNFGLYHPFDNGCATNDFAQLTSQGCSLPFDLLSPADDVPNQADPSGGCPQPGTTNGCVPLTVLMFQNYMDYTYDACYSMFTKGEVKRMEWVLENCRAGYLTTKGGQYPDNMQPLDAGIHSIVNPGGFDFDSASCTPKEYPDLNCPGAFAPQIRITNEGTSTLTALTVTTTINNTGPVSKIFSLNLPTGKSQILLLPNQLTVTGVNNLKFTLSAPNGGVDGNIANDTFTISFTVAAVLPLPYTESFEATVFPPNNGTVIDNPDAGITWERTDLAGKPGKASMVINIYNYEPDDNGNTGQKDLYQLPKIDVSSLDSVTLTFNVAYKQYFGAGVNTPPNDTLNILYSADCGVTWLPTEYSKGGAVLRTVNTTTDSGFVPYSPTHWRTERLVFKDFCAKGLTSLMLGFESINRYGNNMFIDSIDLHGYQSLNTNAALQAIVEPLAALCVNNLTPLVKFYNAGLDSIKTLNINYSIDNGAVSTYKWTGGLARCDSAVVELGALNTTVGTHTILVYLSEPNGAADQSMQNDTLQKTFTIYTDAEMPIVEGFEDAGFPGSNWGVQNVNGGTSFERSTNAARAGGAAISINNPNAANFNGAIDYLISPIIQNNGLSDSIFVDFDLSYRQGFQYPGSTVFPLDTLEVLATNDCGASFKSVWKKWGYTLQTVKDPSYSSTDVFIPVLNAEWRHERIFLTPHINSSDFQLYFAMRGNKQNNLWLDNINISALTLPQRLKDQGYLIYPNPFNSSFVIHHYAVEPPVSLQSVQVYSSSGQLTWQKQYNGTAERKINIDLKKAAAGVYILKIIYRNKTVVEKIVKQ